MEVTYGGSNKDYDFGDSGTQHFIWRIEDLQFKTNQLWLKIQPVFIELYLTFDLFEWSLFYN